MAESGSRHHAGIHNQKEMTRPVTFFRNRNTIVSANINGFCWITGCSKLEIELPSGQKQKQNLGKITLLWLISTASMFGVFQVNAAEYDHHIGAFGLSISEVENGLQNKCDKLISRTIPKLLSVAKKSQRQLECTGYEYFGKKRFVEIMFSDDQLDIIHIMNMRDMLPDLKHMLQLDYGEPTVSAAAVDYFASAGISLRVFPDEISFISARAKDSYNKYVDDIKDNHLDMSLTKQQWLSDLAMLDIHIRNHHVNPFWHNNESGYTALFYQAHDYIANTAIVDPLVVNGFIDKLVAYIADGHSYVLDRNRRFGFYAYKSNWFSDGLFITQTDDKNAHLLGAKILAFDNTPIEVAAEMIRAFMPIVNSSSIKLESKYTYQYAGLLYAAGIAEKPDTVTLSLEIPSGETISHNFEKDERDYRQVDFVDLNELNSHPKPLYRKNNDQPRWFEYIANDDALYVHYGSVIENNDDEIARFFQEVMQFVESEKPGKLIIDVRNNGGGDSHLNAPLINAIAKNQHINQRGKLFVITGHNSFSAAINFSGNMEVKTRALFAGEKVGDSASFAGEAGSQAKYRLPNSHIILSLSFSEWNTTYDNDERDAVALDIPVELSSSDFLSGRDPVLRAVLDYKARVKSDVVLTQAQQQKWIGRYDFSPDKALKIDQHNSQLQLEITELAFSNLYPVSPTEMRTDMNGIRLKILADGNVELVQLGSENRELKKLENDDFKPLELLISGQVPQAKASYMEIYAAQPKLLSIRGNSMGILATHLRARYNSQELYDQVRDITVAMHGFPIYSWLDW